MATKPTKRPAARKPVAAARPAPRVEETVILTGCGCQHKHGGFWRFLKWLLIIVIFFALGFMCCKAMFMCKAKKMMRHAQEARAEMFVNGCLDISKIKCPEMAQKVVAADANGDGCIAKDEFKSFKMAMRSNKGDKDCGCNKRAWGDDAQRDM